MKQFDIYTRNGCGWCEKAKQLLQSKGYTYTERHVGVNATKEEIQQRVTSLGVNTKIQTVPQIFLLSEKNGTTDTYIGGFDQLDQQIKNNQV